MIKILIFLIDLFLFKFYRWLFVLGNNLCCVIDKVDFIYGLFVCFLRKCSLFWICILYVDVVYGIVYEWRYIYILLVDFGIIVIWFYLSNIFLYIYLMNIEILRSNFISFIRWILWSFFFIIYLILVIRLILGY